MSLADTSVQILQLNIWSTQFPNFYADLFSDTVVFNLRLCSTRS